MKLSCFPNAIYWRNCLFCIVYSFLFCCRLINLICVEGSLLSTHSPNFITCRLINYGHSDWCEVVPHHSFDLHFSTISHVEHLFMSYWVSVYHWRSLCLGLLLIFFHFSLGCLFIWYWIVWAFCKFWRLIFWQLLHLQILSPILRIVFSSRLWFPLLFRSFCFLSDLYFLLSADFGICSFLILLQFTR